MRRFTSLAEFLLIVILFFVMSGGAVPDVNEAHYLTKAKSFWQPDWCGRELFLRSANAHLIFYCLFGWVTKYLSLPATAWVGRIAGWSMLSGSWMWLMTAIPFHSSVLPHSSVGPHALSNHANNGNPYRPGLSLLTAAIAVSLWQYAHMAGEWVVGGFEAKVPSYALVFATIGCIFRNRLATASILLGAAIALHPIVGGWSALALVYAYFRRETPGALASRIHQLPMFAIVCGLAIAAVGIVPAIALNRASADVADQANRIYVFQRLPHHLVIQGMLPIRIGRFVAMVAVWLGFRIWSNRNKPTGDDFTAETFINHFADASLMITAAGVALCFLGGASESFAAKFLKYYFFRLADIAVPVSIAVIVVGRGISMYQDRSKRFAFGFVAVMSCLVLAVALRFSHHRSDPRPGGDRQGQILSATGQKVALRRYNDWKAMCDWARQFTPTSSLFLTPTFSQTFKWYAERAELATWKDTPQDAQSVVEWSALRQQIGATGVYQSETATDLEAIHDLIQSHELDFIVTVRAFGQMDWDLPLVYQNESFQIHRCPKNRARASQ